MSHLGNLYLVATPIGNLGDITYRAVEVLNSVVLIAAEDTRHSKYLLTHYNIQTPVISLHEHNEQKRSNLVLEKLKEGKDIALISDAGTPLISDPGYRLVDNVLKGGFNVIPIPGACAAIAALVASGLPTDRFLFEGFIPAKGQMREKVLEKLAGETRTIILYESVHRIINLISLLSNYFGGERVATIARELTKKFETVKRATLTELEFWLKKNAEQVRGEFVVIVQGAVGKQPDNDFSAHVLKTLIEELPLKQSVNLAMKITGAKRKSLYQQALVLKNGNKT